MGNSRRKSKSNPPAESPNPATRNILRLDACQSRNLAWLWDQRIPLGKATLLVGDPDSGKSFVALDLAARVSRGQGIPPEAGLPHSGQVLLLCADDDVEDTILPRLEAADANLSRIAIIPAKPAAAPATTGPDTEADDREQPTPQPIHPERSTQALLSLANDLGQLEAALDDLPDCRLIVIDPINAYLRGLAGHNDIAIRQILQKLTRLARERNAAILMTAHQRKQVSSTALYRPIGSVAFAAVARVVLLLAHDPNIAGRRLLVPAKMTLHAAPSGRAFSIDDGRINWEPEPVELSADDIRVIVSDADQDPHKAAKEWLINQIGEKPLTATEIKRRAAAARIPWRLLWAAKKACQATSYRDPKDHRYYWKMPEFWVRDPVNDLIAYV